MTACKYTALVVSLMCASFAHAQTTQEQYNRDQPGQQARQPGQAGQPGQRQVGQAGRLGTAGQGNEMDTLIASCLLISNQEEVALAQLAADRAENEDVKQFAQTLINDHQELIRKVQPHAKQGISLTASASQPQAGQSGQSREGQLQAGQSESRQPQAGQSPTAQQYTARRQDISRGMADSGMVNQILQMQKDAAQECLSMTKSMLQEKQGADFDKAFAGMQVGAHVGLLAKLKASERHASPQLTSVIQEATQVTQQHLEKAKQLCKQLEDES